LIFIPCGAFLSISGIFAMGERLSEMSDQRAARHREAIMMQSADQQLRNAKTSGRIRTRLIVLIAASCVGALVLWNAQPMRAKADAVDVPNASSISPSAVFEYFPDQYRNGAQRGSAEEHIQAF
jgi:hypothetical protein